MSAQASLVPVRRSNSGDRYADELARLRTFFNTGRTKSFEWRQNTLVAMREAIRNHEKRIYAAAASDLGRPIQETVCSECSNVIGVINETLKVLPKWTAPLEVPSPAFLQPATSKVVYEPKGVVLNIASWNYPTVISLVHLVTGIAAGNCVIAKPPEAAPESCKVVASIVAEMLRPVAQGGGGVEGGIAVFQSPRGPIDMGQIMNPERMHYDHIVFTGGTQIGRIVLKAAANNLTPCSLELGGKSPVLWCWPGWVDAATKYSTGEKNITEAATVVEGKGLASSMMSGITNWFTRLTGSGGHPTLASGPPPSAGDGNVAAISTALKRLIWSKMLNAGQTCTTPDYVLLIKDPMSSLSGEEQADLFVKQLIAWLDHFYAAGGAFFEKPGSDGRAFFEKPGSDGKERASGSGSRASLRENADFGRIINKIHYNRIVSYLSELEAAEGEGVKIIRYNEEHPHLQPEEPGPLERRSSVASMASVTGAYSEDSNTPPGSNAGSPRDQDGSGGEDQKKNLKSLAQKPYVPPTFVVNPPANCQLMENEIFGPILPIVVVENVREAFTYIAGDRESSGGQPARAPRAQPLALYCFTNLKSCKDEVLHSPHAPTSGSVLFNDCIVHDTNHDLPWGGVGTSGMGRLHGHHAFKALSNERAVMDHDLWFDTPDRYPPYKLETAGALRVLLAGDWLKGLIFKPTDRKQIRQDLGITASGEGLEASASS